MKLKRLLSLAGFLAAFLIFTGGRLQAANLIDVGDAQAFAGGNDTVDVFVTLDSAYVGAQVTLSFDKTKLSYQEGSLVYNQTAWNPAWGAPQVSVDTDAGTVTVAFLSLTNVSAALPKTSVSLKLFSVVLDVDAEATTGTTAISSSGIVTSRTADYDVVEYAISGASALSGDFVIQGSFTLAVDSVTASPGIATAVPVYLTNISKATGVQLTIAYDSSQVYYAGTVESNTAAWASGTPETPDVVDFGDSLRVSLYSLSATANLPVSNDARWIAKVYLKSKSGATEATDNALTLTQGIVVTTDANFNAVDNPATLIDGNFYIESKHSLRISRDAAAPLGGSDTVMVYLKNSETLVAIEAELMIDSGNFTVSQSDVTLNSAIYSGGVSSTVTVTDSTVKVVALPANPLDSISASATEKMLFSVVLHVKSAAATGYDSLNATALATSRDANFDLTEVPITAVTKGVFLIRSPFEYQVQSKTASPQTEQTVNILLTNRDKVTAAQLVVKYNTSQLTYGNSVTANSAIWTGGAPTPDVTAAGDSIRIGLIDLTGTKSIPAGGSGQQLVSIKFQLNSSLANGDASWITVSGVVAVTDENFNTTDYAATGVSGYIAVYLDITPPSPVTEAMATAGTSSIMLSWKNPSDSDLGSIKIVRTADGMDDVTVVMDEAPVAGATGSFEDTGISTGVEYTYVFTAADVNGNESQAVTAGPVSIGPPAPTTYLKVRKATAVPGGSAMTKVQLYSADSDIAGIGFKMKFDPAKLQITDMMAGKDSAGLTPVGEIDIVAANTAGEFVLSAIDLSGSNPILAGGIREVLVVTFMVLETVTAPDSIPVTLENASLSDPAGADVALSSVMGGYVKVIAQVVSDLDGDGETNSKDLWYYLYSSDEVPFEALAAMLADMLAQPLPSTLLAAVQDVVSTAVTADGAALIKLNTDYEIIAARFTFSYDQSYGRPDVQLSQALTGKVFIKPMLVGGKLVVDIISLTGLVPSQLGSGMFSVSFPDKDQSKAGLTLEKVETADRNGTVRIEAAKVNGGSALPRAYALSQNSPNPFNPSTTISYEIPESDGGAKVSLTVYNIRGQKVITLVDELKEAGQYSINWDGRDLSGNRVSSGVYFYRMQAGNFTATRKMVILE